MSHNRVCSVLKKSMSTVPSFLPLECSYGNADKKTREIWLNHFLLIWKKNTKYPKIFFVGCVQHGRYGHWQEFCAGQMRIMILAISEIKLILWRPVCAPGWQSNQLAMYPCTLVHSVQSLYISCYVLSNKLVLLYLLLCLLPQWWPWSGCTLCIVHCTSVHCHSHVSSYQRRKDIFPICTTFHILGASQRMVSSRFVWRGLANDINDWSRLPPLPAGKGPPRRPPAATANPHPSMMFFSSPHWFGGTFTA
jgi:hypothetical protein